MMQLKTRNLFVKPRLLMFHAFLYKKRCPQNNGPVEPLALHTVQCAYTLHIQARIHTVLICKLCGKAKPVISNHPATNAHSTLVVSMHQ